MEFKLETNVPVPTNLNSRFSVLDEMQEGQSFVVPKELATPARSAIGNRKSKGKYRTRVLSQAQCDTADIELGAIRIWRIR